MVLDSYPSVFAKFMLFYYGFFGITLSVYPKVHAADGPFPNPMAYWTTIGPDLEFGFRIAGIATLAVAFGPMFDLLGHQKLGALKVEGGVKEMLADGGKMSFCFQLLFVNAAIFIVFLYYSFYAPLDNAAVLIWKCQTGFGGAILAWNLIEAFGTDTAVTAPHFAQFVTAFFGFFAVSLFVAPSFFFGPPSPVAYWTVWTDLGVFCARSVGASLMCLLFVGYYLYAVKTILNEGFMKQIGFLSLANLPLFILPAFYGGASPVSWIWQAQLMIQIPISIYAVFVLLHLAQPAWKLTLKVPEPFGANVETFNFISLLWIVPFCIGFISDPNALFGPSSTITPIPMFLTDLDETALWFGKVWAMNTFVIVVGPYLFGLPALSVAKQLCTSFLVNNGLFVHALLTTTSFNPLMMWPLTGFNTVLLAFGLYVASPGVSGQPLL
jgi:hypothetical protein